MPTGQTIINNALTALGILEQSGDPSTSDSNDALAELNAMWEAWGIDEGLIYAQTPARFPLAANVGSYTIGPGGFFNIPQMPARIYRAVFTTVNGGAIATQSLGSPGEGYAAGDTGLVPGANGAPAAYVINTVGPGGVVETYTITAAGTGFVAGYGYQTQTGGAQPGAGVGFTLNILTVSAGGQTRTELKVVEANTYYGHRDLQASAQTPDECYPSYNPDSNGFARIHLFPVPTIAASAATLELDIGVLFVSWTLADNYVLPPGFQDAIQYALAWRLLPRFGVAVAKEVAEVIEQLGEKSQDRILKMNALNRQKPMPAPSQPGARPAPQPTV